MNGAVRVLLVDDHPIVREGYRRLLEATPGLTVAGEAMDGAEAYRMMQALAPDVIAMDLSMPGQGGIEAIRHIRQRAPDLPILALTMHQSVAFAMQAFQAGATGYVTKSSPPDLLIRAVFDVACGRRVLSPDISDALARSRLEGARSPLEELTPREFEILRMLVGAVPSEEIATTLHLSPKTVANYHYALKAKLGCATDIELVRMAERLGVSG